MPRNEKTSKQVAKIAGEVLAAGKATPKQAKTLAASVLTQAPDKRPASKPAPKAPSAAAPRRSGKR